MSPTTIQEVTETARVPVARQEAPEEQMPTAQLGCAGDYQKSFFVVYLSPVAVKERKVRMEG